MKWYSKLSIHQKINAKECFKMLCGVNFGDLDFILSFRQRIDIMEQKLLMEGFILD